MSREQRVESLGKILDFIDLVAWQKAHELAVYVYHITKKFPASEQFGITNQIRRAAVSITSNIAEGFGRRTSADRTHFYDIARGSLFEVQSQFLLARDIEYVSESESNELAQRSLEAQKILTGLINATKNNT